MSGNEIHYSTAIEALATNGDRDHCIELVIDVYDQWNNPAVTGPTPWCAWTYKDGGDQVAA